jgi:hypothetical protein
MHGDRLQVLKSYDIATSIDLKEMVEDPQLCFMRRNFAGAEPLNRLAPALGSNGAFDETASMLIQKSEESHSMPDESVLDAIAC